MHHDRVAAALAEFMARHPHGGAPDRPPPRGATAEGRVPCCGERPRGERVGAETIRFPVAAPGRTGPMTKAAHQPAMATAAPDGRG
jgi:hypothetical protein